MPEKPAWTPGPWIYSGPGSRIGNGPPYRGVFAELDGKFWCVAQMTYYRYSYGKGDEIHGEQVEQEAEANARLIAKSPEMAELLKLLSTSLCGPSFETVRLDWKEQIDKLLSQIGGSK